MAPLDMRNPPVKDGQEKLAKAGANFDPKNFKGNLMLFTYLNEISLSLLKQKFEHTAAFKQKKRKITKKDNDFNTKLP